MDKGEVIHKDKPQNLRKELEELSLAEKKEEEEEDEEERKLKEEIAEEMRRAQIEMIKKKKAEMHSEQGKSETEVVKISSINKEESVEVTLATYGRYIIFNKKNWIIFPITVFFFVASEVINTFYMRFLAEYDNQKSQSYTLFRDF